MKKVVMLIEELMASPETADDESQALSLLSQFHRGAPLDYLRPLLLSPDPRLVSLGAWIASELGEQGKPLLHLVGGLLTHPAKGVRFDIIDCVLLWAGPSGGCEIAQVVQLIADPEKAVRWKVMGFLARASSDQLESALAYLDKEEPRSRHAFGLRWLLSAGGRDVETIESELRSPDARMRKYAAVAAVRMSTKNRRPLLLAVSSDDPEVAEFATDKV
jgi:hypothetical protein